MPGDLEDLSRRIKSLQHETGHEPKQTPAPEGGDDANASGMRAGLELAAPIFGGGAIGYGLDHWLGTLPLFLLIFFFLGVATGFYNVYKLTR